MKLKLLVGILLFLIVLNVATIGSFLYSQWRPGGRYEAPLPDFRGTRQAEHRRHFHEIAPENREELRRLLVELHQETHDLREQIGDLEIEAFSMLERDPVPRDSLNQLIDQIAGLRVEVNRRAIDKLIESKIHLDPREQRIFFSMILGSRSDPYMGPDHMPRHRPRDGSGRRRHGGRN